MENPSRSHDLGIKTDAHNHNTSKNSLGNKLKHAVASHGGKSLSIFHRRHWISTVSSNYRFYSKSTDCSLLFVLMRAFMRITEIAEHV